MMEEEPYAYIAGFVESESTKAVESLSFLQENGVNFWDEVVDCEETIVDGIVECSLFVVLVSQKGTQLTLTRDEIICAMSNRRAFLVIHLEPTDLPEGLELALAGQATVRMYEKNWKKDIVEFLNILWKPMVS